MNTEEIRVADIEIDEVRPDPHGFTLAGWGEDRGWYRLELVLDFPLDDRTRRVLGELLSQAAVRVYRRAPEPLGRDRPASRRREPQTG